MRAEWFTFKPEFKLWLSTNHKPVIKETSDAIWDRIRLIPFTVRIPDNKLIPASEVQQMFSEERSGIFNWMLEGLGMWRTSGLGVSDDVRRATSEYRTEMDALTDFIDECCAVEPAVEVTVRSLYESYTRWCEQNQERPLRKRAFGARFCEKGFDQYQKTTGDRAKTWLGIGLKN
jgi:putative DNA primase/helicase